MRTESLRDLFAQFPDIDGFWNFDDLKETETKVRNLLSDEKGVSSSRHVELLTLLARVQGLSGNFSEAGATLLLANDLLTKHNEEGVDRAKVRFLIEQGRFFGLSMNSAQSIAYFLKAWELAVRLKETFFSIEAAIMLSISQPPKAQNDWLQKVTRLAEETQDLQSQLWLTQLYVMNGWHNFDFRKYEDALANFQKALARPQTTQDTSKTQSIEWAVARTLRALNRLPEALEIQQNLLSKLRGQGKVNGHVFLETGECLQLMKRQDEAKEYFELAYKELSLNGWYSDNKSSELSRMQHIFKKK